MADSKMRRGSMDDAVGLYPPLPYPMENGKQRIKEQRMAQLSVNQAKQKYNYVKEKREKMRKQIYGNRIY